MREVNYDERWKAARDLSCKINLWPTVENLQHIDAALRRVKADGVREAKTYIAKRVKQGENFVGGPDPVIQRAVICSEIMEWLDARAAQIEEGE